ncbi:uncharacterized protein L201_002164 [Kwoniella dendrophila CBS 6074]|uniref:Protein CPL1-like domain-containing protein n=1 Tax=Kwoniella dendrophila CBS 6074 TaxID=1295534 RepID=A0AAX4JQF4_9TREE
MFSKPFVIISILSLLSFAQAVGTFVGCVLTATAALTGTSTGRVANQNACNTRCLANQQTPFTYSYFANNVPPPLLGAIGGDNCWCDDQGSYVAASAYLVGSGTTSSSCVDAIQATATDLRTTFQFQGCTNTLTGVVFDLVGGSIIGGALVQDPQSCFQRCAGNTNAYFIPLAPLLTAIAPTYGCVCDPSGPGLSNVCGIAQYYKYSHSASASQNAQARKRQLEAKKRQDSKRQSFCPKRMTACTIPGVENSWECIDSSSDLESCGGCTNGEYTSQVSVNATATATGLDCTSMPGVLMGGSTCTNGKCVAFACKKKFKLVNGSCVRG